MPFLFKQPRLSRHLRVPDGLYLADILGGQRVADGHLTDDVLHRHVQPRALPVVGREDEIHPSLGQQVLHAGRLLLWYTAMACPP